ncbi:phage holin family protein [Streptomyces sp. NPDC058739]|uniref:phage holin family protein n=1 Tax=Streptomyces sp. NPDC058739 TaxID=3346618 RepID=UPI00368A47B0
MSSARPLDREAGPGARPSGDESAGELVERATRQLTELVRGELRLAQEEMKEKGRRYGKGGGMFGGAGVCGFLTLQALVATAVAALAVPLPVWAAALIVTAVLGLVTAVLARAGKKQVAQGSPPAPRQAIDGVKADLNEIKESARR